MSDTAVLEVFSQSAEPELSTPEVASQLRISKPATWRRLSALYEEGLLEKHPSSGLRTATWSLTDSGHAALEEIAEEEHP